MNVKVHAKSTVGECGNEWIFTSVARPYRSRHAKPFPKLNPNLPLISELGSPPSSSSGNIGQFADALHAWEPPFPPPIGPRMAEIADLDNQISSQSFSLHSSSLSRVVGSPLNPLLHPCVSREHHVALVGHSFGRLANRNPNRSGA